MRRDTCIIGLAVATLICGGMFASATTYVVDAGGTGDFDTIQAAVDAAAPGDTLLILAGNYIENVECTSKRLRYFGEGQGITRIVAEQDAPAVEILDTSAPSTFRDLTVLAYSTDGWAVRFSSYGNFYNCELVGTAGGGGTYGAIGLWDSSVQAIEIQGHSTSAVSNSSVGSAVFAGWAEWDPWGGGTYIYPHSADVSESDFGDVHLSSALLDCEGISTDHLSLSHWRSACDALDSEFGSIYSFDCANLGLSNCVVNGSIDIHGQTGAGEYVPWHLRIEDTLVQGEFSLRYDMIDEGVTCTLQLLHNTIIGDVFTDFWFWDYWSGIYLYRVRGNIVHGYTTLDGDEDWWYLTTVSHNDFVGGFTAFAPPDSVYANISEDPLFCGAPGGDYTLQDCSPCVGAAHDGGDIGAFGVGCSCMSLVEETTWGRVKAMFRQPSN